jgi:hypothetical protein
VPVSDTPAAADTLFRKRLMERSAEERLQMACNMFDDAVALIAASLPPEMASDLAKRRAAVFERMYWPERDEPLIRSVVAALRNGQ